MKLQISGESGLSGDTATIRIVLRNYFSNGPGIDEGAGFLLLLPRDALSGKLGNAIVSRPSVPLSVRNVKVPSIQVART